MAEPSFVHLRIHSQYSLIDSVLSVKQLIKEAGKQELPAVGLTDHCNFFGLVKFYKAAIGAGIKPIIGSDFIFSEAEDFSDDSLITLLAMNEAGYKNITEIISLAYLEGQNLGVARIRLEWLEQYNEGVIALSGAKFGNIGQQLLKGNDDQAEVLIQRWMALYPDRFYLELQRTGRVGDENYLHAALVLAEKFQCPVVATNDVRFASSSDFESHEARICIRDGDVLANDKRERRYTDQQYLRTPDEMLALFADIPSALQNSVEIAKRCNVQLHLGECFLPEYPIPEDFEKDPFFQNNVPYDILKEQTVKSLEEKWRGKEGTAEYAKELLTGIFFRKISIEGLDERLSALYDITADDFPETKARYIARLEFELDIVLQMGFPGYFLIVMDFIQWAKDQEIPVGPGRGSGAGSLIAYAQKITDLDPLEYDLLFERFLNPERVSMPDFDVDFCMERREEVIKYVSDNYGKMAVSQIITFGTMAAKAVVRDVARVQGKSYGVADKLSKLIPFTPGITLGEAIEEEPQLKEFVENDADAGEIWGMARQLEGTNRNVGKHAGGVVIAPTKLTDFSPLYCDEEGQGLVTQFDKGDVEEAGLVKFDFLGLRTLTIIDWALKTIQPIRAAKGEEPLDIMDIDLDDRLSYALIKRAETTAVFQLESRGMKDLIKRLQPDNLEDMIALVALFRPGPLDSGMVDDFVNRKHGRAKVAYPDAKYEHECLEPILKPTYGVIVYQEQVMQIAQELAGYSLGGADMLRRAMGKKKPEEMAKQRGTFKEGAISQGVDPDLAMKIFDLVEKFAGYGFNKSHSAAYALVSYQTAWLKAHYPAPFMAAVMSSEVQNTDKIVTLIEECRHMELGLINPDINSGQYLFTVNDAGEIIYGLAAIKGLGEGPIESLLQARAEGGPFTDLFDFCARTDARKVNKRALEALVKAGAFDTLDVPRWVLMKAIPDAVKAALQQSHNSSSGIDDLFGVMDDSVDSDVYEHCRNVQSWTGRERLAGEKETLGVFLTGHPIDDYEDDLKQLKVKRLSRLHADKRAQTVAGMIVEKRFVKTKRGDSMAIITLDDGSGRIDATIFAKTLPDVQDKLGTDDVIIVKGEIENDEYAGGLRMRVMSIMDIGEARAQGDRAVKIKLSSKQWTKANQALLREMLFEVDLNPPVDELLASQQTQESQGCKIKLQYQTANASCELHFAPQWRIQPSDDVMTTLKRTFGENSVSLS
ncbi:MAG: DNA polymerase III subunit alpha [Pseudomonadales bacterium]|nr:DNA polymerase III subunit alpha [Pseudomonadales bacterium]